MDFFRVILCQEIEQRNEPFVQQFFHPLAGQPIGLKQQINKQSTISH